MMQVLDKRFRDPLTDHIATRSIDYQIPLMQDLCVGDVCIEFTIVATASRVPQTAQQRLLSPKCYYDIPTCYSQRTDENSVGHSNEKYVGLGTKRNPESDALNIPFHLVQANEEVNNSVQPGQKRAWSEVREAELGFSEESVARAVLAKVTELRAGCVVTDFCPLREPRAWIDRLVALMPEHIPVCQVKLFAVLSN
ncbi:unnamed protein product [Echinostoma caproni]|uniref:Arrestin_C domain-containing protein n=1 Tax=Echinostoma caproni TaxID=27848 RepID=A0A183AJB2_9TREM|nr:unnamed protein product [Echinostoma caproni]